MARAVTSKTESMTIRVPIDMMVELRAAAGAQGMSVAGVIIARLRGHTAWDTQVRSGMTLVATLPIELGNVTGLRVEGDRVVASSEAGIDFIVPKVPVLPRADIDPKVHHSAGPVLKSAIPQIEGDTAWSGLKETKS